jgi:hypothetical protein
LYPLIRITLSVAAFVLGGLLTGVGWIGLSEWVSLPDRCIISLGFFPQHWWIDFFVIPGLGGVAAAWGLQRLWQGRAPRMTVEGICPCGYDLTGNKSGLCPECGSVVLTRVHWRTPREIRPTSGSDCRRL